MASVSEESKGSGVRDHPASSPAPDSADPASRTAHDPSGSVDQNEFVRDLFNRYGRDLLAHVTGLTGGDRQRAEDVVQETLLRAWRHAHAINPALGSVRGWLLRVARNIVIDGYRAARARPTEVPSEAADRMFVPDRTDCTLTALVIRRALGRLRPEQRDAIVEVYYWGSTAVEAAAALGIPVGTVKSRVFYGLLALRSLLEEDRLQD